MKKCFFLISISLAMLLGCSNSKDEVGYNTFQGSTSENRERDKVNDSTIIADVEFGSPYERAKEYTSEEINSTENTYAYYGWNSLGQCSLYRLRDDINNEGLLIYPTTPVDIDGDGLANTEECTFFAYDPGYDGSTSCIGYLWLTIPEATYTVGGIAKPNYREYEEFSYFIELNGNNYLVWEKSGIYNEDGEEGTVIYSGNADVSYYIKSEIVFNDLSTIFDSNIILNPAPFFFKYMFYTADGTLTGVYLATNGAHYASLNQEYEDKYIELINKQNKESGIWGNDISEEYNEDYDEFIVELNHNFEERGIDNFIDWINQEQKDINVICGLKYIPEDSAYILPWQATHSPKKMTSDKLNMQVSYCYNNSLYIEKEEYSEDEIEYLEEET